MVSSITAKHSCGFVPRDRDSDVERMNEKGVGTPSSLLEVLDNLGYTVQTEQLTSPANTCRCDEASMEHDDASSSADDGGFQ